MKCKLYTIEVLADDDTIAYTVVCEDNTMHRVCYGSKSSEPLSDTIIESVASYEELKANLVMDYCLTNP